jgi:type III pantothenate kinase
MLLCLDVGNTHILGGIMENDKVIARFRYATHLIGTADQFGIFLLNILQANQLSKSDIHAVAVCSVVPSCDYTLQHTFSMYFNCEYYVLKSGAKTGLNIKVKHPNEVGADRIANAIGGINAFPNKNLIIIDMGTATTVCAINSSRDYLGGSIFPGLRLGMESLRTSTAKLMEVNIEKPTSYVGKTTRESIQIGLYFGKLGALREIISGLKQEIFSGENPMIIGTGGFSQLYRDKSLFDVILPDLVLQGLSKAYEYSTKPSRQLSANH